MPRPVRIRASYTADANYILRLKEAVEGDSRPLDWRNKIADELNSLAINLLEAPSKEATSS